MGLTGFRESQVLDIGIRPYTLSPKNLGVDQKKRLIGEVAGLGGS